MQVYYPHPRAVMVRLWGTDPAKITDEAKIGDIQGWDSLAHVTLLIELNEQYGIPVSRASFEACSSLRGILSTLEKKGIINFEV